MMDSWNPHIRKRLMAWGISHGYGRRYAKFIEPYKRRLFSGLAGTVLEIGPGAGANLQFLSTGVRWMGAEPNPFMHKYLRVEAGRLGRSIELCGAMAEALPLADRSADNVISTLVLCSVRDPPRALAEIRRVLRPGGKLLFIEHVAAG
jgi:ubiquinone/menaquinone biosynthesis C-methylase UbiE